jgi:flagellin-specific chaperone FliS
MPREHASRDAAPRGGAHPVYERLSAELRRAAELLPAADPATCALLFEGAASLVVELQSTLVRQPSAEVAARLAALYAYFAAELAALARTPEAERLVRLTRMVERLCRAAARGAADAAAPITSAPEEASVLRPAPDTV